MPKPDMKSDKMPYMKTVKFSSLFPLFLAGSEKSRDSGSPGTEGPARGPLAAVFCWVPVSCIRAGTASSPVPAAGPAHGQVASR